MPLLGIGLALPLMSLAQQMNIRRKLEHKDEYQD
jgi:hypothetical protein